MRSAHLLAILQLDEEGRPTTVQSIGIYSSRYITQDLRNTTLSEMRSAEGEDFGEAHEKIMEYVRAHPRLRCLAPELEFPDPNEEEGGIAP